MLCQEVRKRKRVESAESKWETYFHKIRDVCPWSWSAWQRGRIDIVDWEGIVLELGDQEARVYVCNYKPRLLKKVEKRINELRTDEEWLHSHPSFGERGTPVPVLIQQDLARLQMLREKVGYYG